MTSYYAIVPAGPRPFYLMAPVILVILGALAVLAWTLVGSQFARLELDEAGIRFHGDLWGRKPVPLTQVRSGDARVINLAEEPDLAPRSRRMGTGLPGYASGWFRLRNGEKSLVYLTDRSRVVYIPTDLGYSIMASVADPEKLVADLRARR